MPTAGLWASRLRLCPVAGWAVRTATSTSDTMLHGQGASMALPIWTKYMVKVLGDKSLGYDENETFQLPEGYDPCKDDVNLEGDTHIEEPIEGLDELFN